jgi:hypothetical protein
MLDEKFTNKSLPTMTERKFLKATNFIENMQTCELVPRKRGIKIGRGFHVYARRGSFDIFA